MKNKSFKKKILTNFAKSMFGFAIFGSVASAPLIYSKASFSNNISYVHKFQNTTEDKYINSVNNLNNPTSTILKESSVSQPEIVSRYYKSTIFHAGSKGYKQEELKHYDIDTEKLNMSPLTAKLKDLLNEKLTHAEKISKLKSYYVALERYRSSLLEVGFMALAPTVYSWVASLLFNKTGIDESICLTAETVLLFVQLGLISYEMHVIDDYIKKDGKNAEDLSFYLTFKKIVSSVCHVSVVALEWCINNLVENKDRQKLIDVMCRKNTSKSVLTQLKSYYENESAFKEVLDLLAKDLEGGIKPSKASILEKAWGQIKSFFNFVKKTFSFFK